MSAVFIVECIWLGGVYKMESKAINQALVSHDAGHSLFDEMEITYAEFVSDFSKLVSAEYNSAGVDKRDIAVGGHNIDLWLFEFAQDPTKEWAAIIEWPERNYEAFLALTRPKKLLLNGLMPMVIWEAYSKLNPEAEAYFVNTYHLGILERFYKDATGRNFAAPYASVSIKELLDGAVGEFDFIGMFAWELDYDNTLLQAVVNAMASGGVLVIAATNLSETLYRDGILHNPNGEFHRFLKEQDGYTYHIASGHGITVFSKR